MAAWPSIDRADEPRLVAGLRAGDTTAVAYLYDAYAPRLFDYCHALLRDQDAAAQALHDAFITVCEGIAELPDPRLLRGRLYAVTRAECARRRAQEDPSAERRPAAEADGPVQIDESTRRLVHSALLVLGGQGREALDLSLRHELDPEELAEVLVMTPQDASVLVAQTRKDLDDAFAAVVVAAIGRDDCPSVAALAGPPDRRLDAEAARRLARHAGNCPICRLRVNGDIAVDRLVSAMPIAAVPAVLRNRVLTTASAPEYADVRTQILMRSVSPPQPPEDDEDEPEPGVSPRVWFVAGAIACGLLALIGIVLLTDGSDEKRPTGVAAASPSDSPSEDPSPSVSASPTRTKATRTPTPRPTPTASSRTPKPTHASTVPVTRPPKPTKTPAQGRLRVTGCAAGRGNSCRITLTAVGGPVAWAVTGAGEHLTAQGSGHLGAGGTTTVTVTVSRPSVCVGGGNGSVSVSPGATASVTWDC